MNPTRFRTELFVREVGHTVEVSDVQFPTVGGHTARTYEIEKNSRVLPARGGKGTIRIGYIVRS